MRTSPTAISATDGFAMRTNAGARLGPALKLTVRYLPARGDEPGA